MALGAYGATEILCDSYLQIICRHLKQLLPRPFYHRPKGKLWVFALSLRPLSHVTRPRTNQSLFSSGSSAPSPAPADFLLRFSTLEDWSRTWPFAAGARLQRQRSWGIQMICKHHRWSINGVPFKGPHDAKLTYLVKWCKNSILSVFFTVVFWNVQVWISRLRDIIADTSPGLILTRPSCCWFHLLGTPHYCLHFVPL